MSKYKLLLKIKKLKKQLPSGMKKCFIKFKQCDKGHGRLTSTNWARQDFCHWCEIDELKNKLKLYECSSNNGN